MEIKFKQQLARYNYLVMFDLASKLSGVCLWDLRQQLPVSTEKILVSNKEELPVAELYNCIDQYFNNLYQRGINKEELLISFEAAPSQMASHAGSTIQTFVALARSHAILDLYLYQHDLAVYDYIGVYPITTHAYFKKIMGFSNDQKITKEDIRLYLQRTYTLSDLSLDESDAVFLAKTLVESKWNKDLEEQIRVCKRHKKTLKASYAIQAVDQEIDCLKIMML